MAKTGTVTLWIREDNVEGMDMAEALRHAADLLERGYTSGHYPTWELVIDEDKKE